MIGLKTTKMDLPAGQTRRFVFGPALSQALSKTIEAALRTHDRSLVSYAIAGILLKLSQNYRHLAGFKVEIAGSADDSVRCSAGPSGKEHYVYFSAMEDSGKIYISTGFGVRAKWGAYKIEEGDAYSAKDIVACMEKYFLNLHLQIKKGNAVMGVKDFINKHLN